MPVARCEFGRILNGFFLSQKPRFGGRGRTAEGMDICQILFWNGSVPFQLGDNVSAATQTIRFVP
jgi:hypothetical protein